LTLSFLVFVSHGASLNSVAWSPDGNYIAIGGALSGGFTVRTYLFDAQAGTLTNVGTANTTGTVNAVAWSPNGLYLLVGYALTGSFDFTIYRTKGNEGGLILAVRGLLGAGVNSVDWLDNKTFAVGGPVSGGASIKVFSFSPEVQGADPLSYEAARPVIFRSLASPGIDIQEVRWSPDKRYLAACGNGAGTNIFVYTFNNGTTLGSSPATATFGATANSLDWSPDGKYIGVGGINTQGLRIYGFSRTAFSLSSPSIVGVTSTINGVSWSPSGEFFATADNGLLVTVYNALVFNAIMNIVKNNIVYGNNGNSLPSGLGISGSSFSNIIVSNTAYNNQFDYEFVTNVFSSGINGSPSILENVSVPPY
ncbi:MAG: WD40 repeat domain-containing protein, partial [Candidatus Babeliales bacterium]